METGSKGIFLLGLKLYWCVGYGLVLAKMLT